MRTSIVRYRHPLIKFLGKRNWNVSVDHSPKVHPESPVNSLPSSFLEYRRRAQTHGPLGGRGATSDISSAALVGGGVAVHAALPLKYAYSPVSDLEIESINSGGADCLI